jgi:hypothetical protein
MIEAVKECEVCGEVCSTMDTMCPRCQRYGTLRRRYQCLRCQRVLDNQTCAACESAEQITSEPRRAPQPSLATEPLEPARSDLVDPHAPHPAVAAAVGGAVFGAAAGAAAAYFFIGDDPLILGLIGLVIGTLVGAVLGGNVSQNRR